MQHTIKVLIVDDEDQFRATTKKILDKRGFDTIVAGSGEEAVELMAEHPEVVILDIKMPGMGGIEALERIRKIAPDVPVIMLTGHGAETTAKDARGHGAFDYLAKPCSMDLLAAKINDAWRQAAHEGTPHEKRVGDVMIPLAVYSTVTPDSTVEEAVFKLRESLVTGLATSQVVERYHVSILVLDAARRVVGVVAIVDLFEGILPAYLSAPKPSTADSIQYSPMFWEGYFTRNVHDLARKKVEDIMSPPPPAIEADANLMEAVYLMRYQKSRRLSVEKNGRAVGVIREQDLLFEMERVLSIRHAE
ncbi:MAG: response regulator [Proteobacteria bacterium]|nr:response regulator [Pseudomonadota bacterium]